MKIRAGETVSRIKTKTVRFGTALVLAVTSSTALIAPAYATTPLASYTPVPLTQSELDTNWTADRALPSGGFNSGVYYGKSNVAQLNVDSAAASPVGFMQTEGIKRDIPASDTIQADIYVDSAWAGKQVRVGLWGVAGNDSNSDVAWPIIEYTTVGDSGFTGFRVFDTMNGGWTNLTDLSVDTGAWYNLEIAYNAATASYDYYVDNTHVISMPASDGTDTYSHLQGVILDNKNFATGDAAGNYSAYWANLGYGTLPTTPATTVHVNSSFTPAMAGFSSNYIYGYNAFPNIQSAVNAVANDGTVNVDPGTYEGFYVTGKTNVSVVGSGVGSTIITPTSLISTGIGHKYTANMQVSVLVNSSNNATISGMTITGGGDAVVLWNSASGTITDSDVSGGRTEATITGAQTGQGIAVDGSSNLTVSNTNITGFQKNGIDIINGNGATSGGGNITVSVQGGSIAGVGPTDKIAQNGMVVWNRGGGNVSALVNGTTIRDLDYTPESDYATGILLYDGGTLDPASNATFTNVEHDVAQTSNSDIPATGTGGTVVIPAGTTITAEGDWNGTIAPPTVTSVTLPATPGYTTTVGLAISVGSDTANLSFDTPVRLVLAGQAGKLAGFIPVGGAFTPITTNCGSDPVTTPPAVMASANECVVTNGGNLVIWTKHFTTFVAYTQTANPSNGGNGSSSSTSQSSTTGARRAGVSFASVVSNGAVDNPAAAVLGDSTNSSKKEIGQVKSTATTNDSKAKESSAFLGLGWWWLPIIAALVGAFYWFVIRRADGTTTASK